MVDSDQGLRDKQCPLYFGVEEQGCLILNPAALGSIVDGAEAKPLLLPYYGRLQAPQWGEKLQKRALVPEVQLWLLGFLRLFSAIAADIARLGARAGVPSHRLIRAGAVPQGLKIRSFQGTT